MLEDLEISFAANLEPPFAVDCQINASYLGNRQVSAAGT